MKKLIFLLSLITINAYALDGIENKIYAGTNYAYNNSVLIDVEYQQGKDFKLKNNTYGKVGLGVGAYTAVSIEKNELTRLGIKSSVIAEVGEKFDDNTSIYGGLKMGVTLSVKKTRSTDDMGENPEKNWPAPKQRLPKPAYDYAYYYPISYRSEVLPTVSLYIGREVNGFVGEVNAGFPGYIGMGVGYKF